MSEWKGIEINFNDNKPYNELDNVRMVKELLDAGTSKTFAFSKLKGLENVEAELLKQEEEIGAYADLMRGDEDAETIRETPQNE